MDFYFDIGMAVILRVIADTKGATRYYRQLAKLLFKLTHLQMVSPAFKAAYEQYLKEQGE